MSRPKTLPGIEVWEDNRGKETWWDLEIHQGKLQWRRKQLRDLRKLYFTPGLPYETRRLIPGALREMGEPPPWVGIENLDLDPLSLELVSNQS